MAVTICLLLMTVLTVAVTDASFPKYQNSFGYDNPMRFEYIRPLSLPSFPNFPVPQPPPLLWPTGFPKPNFPLPTYQPAHSFSIPDIASQPAIPGSDFSGISVQSHTSVSRGPDGKVQKTGGTTLVTNENGQVTMQQIGDSPPKVVRTDYTNVPLGEFVEDPEFTHFKNSFMPTFEPITMPAPMDMNYVPEPNESYQASSFHSRYHSEDNNGVKTSEGESEFLTNDNGNVKRKQVKYQKSPK